MIRIILAFVVLLGCFAPIRAEAVSGPIVKIVISGPISPATDDYFKTSLARASELNARLFVVELNTPGGLLNSMQSMVEQLLEANVPTVVYVSPSGGGAISAGVFITMAAHFAVMAPGTTIGAAHPVTGSGQDVTGDMRAKIENFAATHAKAIAEQRGRNVEWAEKAVRESVAITDREAVEKKVVNFVASNLSQVFEQLEGQTALVRGQPVSIGSLKGVEIKTLEMSFKQQVLNVLADPNIAILLGLGALAGIGIELYHPGAWIPGILGVICLVLSLTAAAVLPINVGGAALMGLSVVFFVVEAMAPSFGIWGGAAILCLILGSIYLVDTEMVWSAEAFTVDKFMVGSGALLAGLLILGASYLVMRSSKRSYSTGRAGLIDKVGVLKTEFVDGTARVQVMGELWRARLELGVEPDPSSLEIGKQVVVTRVEDGMVLVVKPLV